MLPLSTSHQLVLYKVMVQVSDGMEPCQGGLADKMANLVDRLYFQETRQAIRLMVRGASMG